MNCPKCNKPRGKEDAECPYCGVLFSKISSPQKSKLPPTKSANTTAKATICQTCSREIKEGSKTCPHCGLPQRPPLLKDRPNSKVAAGVKFGGILVACVLLPGVLLLMGERSDSPTITKKSYAKPVSQRTIGKVEKQLSFGRAGSQEQAQHLLTLLNDTPNKTKYQISYNTPEDVVIFGCDFNKDILLRMHQRSDGHGTIESWQGDILHRLQSASNGGSINDTPKGKRSGIFQRF